MHPGACFCHHCRPQSPHRGAAASTLFSRVRDPPGQVLSSGHLLLTRRTAGPSVVSDRTPLRPSPRLTSLVFGAVPKPGISKGLHSPGAPSPRSSSAWQETPTTVTAAGAACLLTPSRGCDHIFVLYPRPTGPPQGPGGGRRDGPCVTRSRPHRGKQSPLGTPP